MTKPPARTGGLVTRGRIHRSLTGIAAKLGAAGPAPAQWVAPATPPGFCTAATSTATVRAIFGDQSLVATPVTPATVYAQTIGLVGRNVSCDWRSASYTSLSVRLLAGGSWALPNMVPGAPGDAVYGSTAYLPLSVPGTTSAKVSCGGGTCDAFLAVGTTAAEIVYADPGTSKSASVLAAFAKDIAAS